MMHGANMKTIEVIVRGLTKISRILIGFETYPAKMENMVS